MTAAVQQLKRLLQTRPKRRAASAVYAVTPINHRYISIVEASYTHQDSYSMKSRTILKSQAARSIAFGVVQSDTVSAEFSNCSSRF